MMCVGVGCRAVAADAQMQDAVPVGDPMVQAAQLDLPDAPMMQADAQAASPAQAGASAPASSSSQTEPQPAATSSSGGQSSATPPSAAGTPQGAKTDQQQSGNDVKAAEKQRLLGIMPQFQLVSGGQAAPLTSGQKYNLALHSAIDPFYIAWAFVIGGGWGEVVDSNSGYGWGPAGYFKRVGANYADNVNGAIIGNAVLPSLLHQDPRYFRVGTGSFGHRFLHAALSTVICKGDNGKTQANVSNVLGNFISGGISNLYYPQNERGVSLTLENGLSVTLFGALGGQFLEFGPDINRLVSRHKKRSAAAGSGGGSAPVAPPDAH